MIIKITNRLIDKYPLVVLLFGVLLYTSSLNIWASGDDFSTILFKTIDSNERWEIFQASSFSFRPIENLINAIDAEIDGFDSTIFTHIVCLMGFVISTFLVFLITKHIYPKNIIPPFICSLIFVVMPNNVMAVIQVDAISQQYATVFSLFSFWWLLTKNPFKGISYFIIYGLFLFNALLSKETSLGIAIVMALSAFLIRFDYYELKSDKIKKILISTYVATALVILSYFFLRFIFGAEFSGSGQYHINFSLLNILKNSILLMGATIYTGSTLDFFPSPNFFKISISMVFFFGTIWIFFPFIRTFIHTKRRKISLENILDSKLASAFFSISLIIIFSLIPVILIGKVSELYTYSSNPYYSILIGLLLYNGLSHHEEKIAQLPKQLKRIFIFSYIIWLGIGTQEKISLAVSTSNRTRQYFDTIINQCIDQPKNEISIYLSKNVSTNVKKNYSILYFSDMSILKSFSPLISKLSNKNINYFISESDSSVCDYRVYKDAEILRVSEIL